MRKLIAICPICGQSEDVGCVAFIGNPQPGDLVDVGCGECGEPQLMIKRREMEIGRF